MKKQIIGLVATVALVGAMGTTVFANQLTDDNVQDELRGLRTFAAENIEARGRRGTDELRGQRHEEARALLAQALEEGIITQETYDLIVDTAENNRGFGRGRGFCLEEGLSLGLGFCLEEGFGPGFGRGYGRGAGRNEARGGFGRCW